MDDTFHHGERYVQEHTGERDRAVLNGRTIGPEIPRAAHVFLRQQSHCQIGWRTRDGAVWASVLAAVPGFASADADGRGLTLQLESGTRSLLPDGGHPEPGDHVGLLFLEFSSRRRLRVNGRVADLNPISMRVDVDEAFANCPKYIQRRVARTPARPAEALHAQSGTRLTGDLRAWIAQADTLFVASTREDGRADVSHRGGSPGFVVLEDNTLRIPDYPGNSMFLTLGNLHVCPAVGVTFLDFERRRQLRLTGTASLDFLHADPNSRRSAEPRCWSFYPRAWSVAPLPANFDWELQERSPFNP